MEDNVFKFYLKSDENTYLYVSPFGVQQTTEETDLLQSVDSWEQATIALRRSPIYWAAYQEASVPQSFVKDGATIHRSIFYAAGLLGRCIFMIKKLNRTLRDYALWYSGDIDYSSASDQDYSFSVRVKERGLTSLIKARESVQVELPLNVPSAVPMLVGGTRVGCRATWLLGTTNTTPDSPVTWMQSTPVNSDLLMVAYSSDVIQIANFIKPADQLPLDQDSFLNFNPASLYNGAFLDQKIFLFASLYDLKNVVVTGTLRVGLVGNTEVPGNYTIGVKLWFGRPNQEGASSFTQFTLGTGVLTAPGYIDIPLNAAFDMVKDRVAFVTIRILSAPGGVTNTDELILPQNGSNLSVSFQATVPDTACKGLRYIDAFKSLITKITDNQYVGVSDFLSNTSTSAAIRKANFDNSPYNTIVTSGNGLRGLANATIKTSLTDMFKDCWSNWMLAMGIEGNVVRLEPLSYFFSDNVALHIDHVRNVSVSIWTDKIFNTVEVGYGNYDNNNVVGKNEFNAGLSFLVKENDIAPGEDDIKSPYRADIYGIESIRSETYAQVEQDNRSDNDTFLVEVSPSPVGGNYVPYRPISTITGVDDPAGVYNVALSPGRKLARHLPRIRSFFRKGILAYQSNDKNSELVSNLGAGTITETGSINLENDFYFSNGTNAVLPLFTQYVISFECSPPYMLIEILSVDPKGCISFTYNGTIFKGWILEVFCSPASNDTYTFKLLSHPSNDLSKLRN